MPAKVKKLPTESVAQPSLFSQASVRFAEKGEEVKKNGLFYVPLFRLKTLEGFNDREDYGTAEEMDELAESIYQSGVLVPLKGYKEGENYVVIVGHRRHRAGEIIKAKYGKQMNYPMQVYPVGTTKQDMLLDTLLTNSGKDLTPLEKASTVGKLVGERVPYNEITRALGGVSEVYVKNLHKLSQAPEKIKKLIREGVVSATYVISILKDKKTDLEAWYKEIEELAKDKKKEGKQSKVTKKDREKPATKAASSLMEFKRLRKKGVEEFKNKSRQETWEFVCSLIDNQMSYGEISTYFQG